MRKSQLAQVGLACTLVLPPGLGSAQGLAGLALNETPANLSMDMPGMRASQAIVVRPDGYASLAHIPPAIRLQGEVLDKSESLKDVLSRHNLSNDAKTREMFKALNPAYDPSMGKIAAGSKINVFSVVLDEKQSASKQKFTFDSPNLANFAFSTQAQKASKASYNAQSLPSTAFDTPELANLHSESARAIQRSAATLATQADKLSRLDYAVAQYQIELATKQAVLVNARATSGTVPRGLVLAEAESAKVATEMSMRAAQGKSVTEPRNLRVNVFRGNSSEHVKALQVYVVPSGALSQPENWRPAQLESFLSDFSFANEASPVSQDIPTNFDPRVCVGPKNAIKGMARLIAQGRLHTCRKPDLSGPDATVVLTFRHPSDVAQPE